MAEMEGQIYRSQVEPAGSVSPRLKSPESLADLTTLSETQLFTYLTVNLLQIENELYTEGNTEEHKLLFLIGDIRRNVASAYTSEGQPVYTKPQCHYKYPEAGEAIAAISDYFYENINEEEAMAEVLSEIGDVVFNLAVLTEIGKDFARIYFKSIALIAASMKMELKDLFLVTAAKFYLRLVDPKRKDVKLENEVIRNLVAGGFVKPPAPSVPGIKHPFDDTADRLNLLEAIVLRPRLDMIIALKKQEQFLGVKLDDIEKAFESIQIKEILPARHNTVG